MNSWKYQKIIELVGMRIRSTRQSQELTIEDLAEACDMHPTSLGRVERGDTSPTLHSLVKIADALNTDLAEFLEGIPG